MGVPSSVPALKRQKAPDLHLQAHTRQGLGRVPGGGSLQDVDDEARA